MLLEKHVFIAETIGFVGEKEYLRTPTEEVVYQWLGTIGLALSMLILTEIIGRIMQSIRASK